MTPPSTSNRRQPDFPPTGARLEFSSGQIGLWTNIAFLVLSVLDLSACGGWLASLLEHFAQSNNADRAWLTGMSANALGAVFFACFFGGEVGAAYCIFPLQSLNTPLGRRAYHLLCWAYLIGHPILALATGAMLLRTGWATVDMIGASAPLSLLATPLLLPIARYLLTPSRTETSLVAARRNAGTRPLPNGGKRPQSSSYFIEVALPFVACFRARRFAFAVVAGLLWFGAVYCLIADPITAVVPFVIAAGIGNRVSGSVRTNRSANRLPRVADPLPAIPEQKFAPAPRYLAAAFVSLPPLMIVDTLDAVALLGTGHARTLSDYAEFVTTSCLFLLVGFAISAYAFMAVVPAGVEQARPRPVRFYQFFCGLLGISHFGLLAVLVTIPLAPSLFESTATGLLTPMFQFLAMTSALLAPCAAIVAVSTMSLRRTI